MKKEEVIARVSKVLENKKIHQAFHSIIKEFFVRAMQQYKWTKEDLQRALNSFEYLQDIRFKKMRGLEKGRNVIRRNSTRGKIDCDVEFLKAILLYDIDKIEEFINVMIHEFGHRAKIRNISSKTIEVGIEIIDKRSRNQRQGTIVNEIVECMSAKKLQNGNFLEGKYIGYFHMQSAVQAAIYAWGLSEEQLFYIQWQGRKAYEEAIAKEIGELLGNTCILNFDGVKIDFGHESVEMI